MHRITSAMVGGLVLAVGAAAIAQPENPRPRTTPGQPSSPGLERTPPGQERTRPMTGQPQLQVDPEVLRQVIATWPEESQKAAEETMKKYGPPNGMTPGMLVWQNNGPWEKTIVSAEGWDHQFPMAHKDVLMNVVKYKVPLDQYDELARFDGSIIAFRTPGELAARCDKEENNILALNVAHEVVTGKRTVEDARQFVAQTLKDLQQGKTSTYTQGLMFEPEQNTSDPDKSVSGPGNLPSDAGDPMRRDPSARPPSPGETSPGRPQPGNTQPGTPSTPRPGTNPPR